ncbi:RICIN domain-containing protein [Kitasatospora sp. NBC_00315]|uniref:RICIN domain-containing protein n=1 Tax=Kitasatospora sp. NBC_00315 TaxID=2975963 RepID=UPI00352E27DF
MFDSFSFTANGTGGGTGGNTVVGTAVQLYDCNGSVAQKWQHTGNTFVNPNSGKCLDAAGQGTADGTRLQIWDCYGSGTQPNQVWSLH